MKSALEQRKDTIIVLSTPLILSSSVLMRLGMYWGWAVSLVILVLWDVVLCMILVRGETYEEGLRHLKSLALKDKHTIALLIAHVIKILIGVCVATVGVSKFVDHWTMIEFEVAKVEDSPNVEKCYSDGYIPMSVRLGESPLVFDVSFACACKYSGKFVSFAATDLPMDPGGVQYLCPEPNLTGGVR